MQEASIHRIQEECLCSSQELSSSILTTCHNSSLLRFQSTIIMLNTLLWNWPLSHSVSKIQMNSCVLFVRLATASIKVRPAEPSYNRGQVSRISNPRASQSQAYFLCSYCCELQQKYQIWDRKQCSIYKHANRAQLHSRPPSSSLTKHVSISTGLSTDRCEWTAKMYIPSYRTLIS